RPGLTAAHASSATPALGQSGTWELDVSFNQQGAVVFDNLTRANVAACPRDPNTRQTANCAERHMGIWLDLTQKDIDNWENADYVAKIYAPYDPGCLSQQTSTTVCGKFLTNPVTIEEISGGAA